MICVLSTRLVSRTHISSASLGDRSPYEMIFQHKQDLAHVRIFSFCVQAWLTPQESKFAERTQAGKYVGLSDSDSLCMELDGKPSRLFHRSRTFVVEELDCTTVNMFSKPPNEFADDSFIEHYVYHHNRTSR